MADIIFEDLLKAVFQIFLPILIILFGLIPSQIFNDYYNLEFYIEEIEKIAVLHRGSEIEIDLPFEIEGSEKRGNVLYLGIAENDVTVIVYSNRIDIVPDNADVNYMSSDILIQRNFLDENLITNMNYDSETEKLIITT